MRSSMSASDIHNSQSFYMYRRASIRQRYSVDYFASVYYEARAVRCERARHHGAYVIIFSCRHLMR